MNHDISPIDHQTRSHTVLSVLREAILTGNLKPGERLIQEKLAERLQTSRMPIREAISQLESEGFVRIEPYKGAVVTELSLHELEELYTIRANLEALAAGLAAQRLSREELNYLDSLLNLMKKSLHQQSALADHVELNRRFHRSISIGSRFQKLVTILDNLWDQSMRYRLTQARIPGRLETAYLEHEQLLKALTERQAEKVSRLVSEHVMATASALARSMSENELTAKESESE